ncbi:MAG TPA: cupin domain-containing protein [Steroidobacteraceae bacterium]|jgi:anti-sigma factor ChrR (cupin superfamily)
MLEQRLHADFSRRVVIHTEQQPWIPSPQAGVQRRPLDRIGGEVARATSIVRFAPESAFPAHQHGLGEELLVLEGVFSDERGDYPRGTYVRDPPGSGHSPRTDLGCMLLVKLRQMAVNERQRVVIDTSSSAWQAGDVAGHTRLQLYAAEDGGERVTMERLGAHTALSAGDCPGGEELLVLSGELADEHGSYGAYTWIRNPDGYRRGLRSQAGATYWAKRGHLRP